jgi:hypothetical protein
MTQTLELNTVGMLHYLTGGGGDTSCIRKLHCMAANKGQAFHH